MSPFLCEYHQLKNFTIFFRKSLFQILTFLCKSKCVFCSNESKFENFPGSFANWNLIVYLLRDSRGKYVIPECEVYGSRQNRACNHTRESHYFPILSRTVRREENRRHVIFTFHTTSLSVSIYTARNFYFPLRLSSEC